MCVVTLKVKHKTNKLTQYTRQNLQLNDKMARFNIFSQYLNMTARAEISSTSCAALKHIIH